MAAGKLKGEQDKVAKKTKKPRKSHEGKTKAAAQLQYSHLQAVIALPNDSAVELLRKTVERKECSLKEMKQQADTIKARLRIISAIVFVVAQRDKSVTWEQIQAQYPLFNSISEIDKWIETFKQSAAGHRGKVRIENFMSENFVNYVKRATRAPDANLPNENATFQLVRADARRVALECGKNEKLSTSAGMATFVALDPPRDGADVSPLVVENK